MPTALTLCTFFSFFLGEKVGVVFFSLEIFSDVQAVSLDTENSEGYNVNLSFKEGPAQEYGSPCLTTVRGPWMYVSHFLKWVAVVPSVRNRARTSATLPSQSA